MPPCAATTRCLNARPPDLVGEESLFETLPGDPGAHGPYVDCEVRADWQMRVRMHPRITIAAAIAVAVAGAAAAARRQPS